MLHPAFQPVLAKNSWNLPSQTPRNLTVPFELSLPVSSGMPRNAANGRVCGGGERCGLDNWRNNFSSDAVQSLAGDCLLLTMMK
jgi:hypothetical protein